MSGESASTTGGSATGPKARKKEMRAAMSRPWGVAPPLTLAVTRGNANKTPVAYVVRVRLVSVAGPSRIVGCWVRPQPSSIRRP